MNNCNPSLINALSLCSFYSPKKAQPLTTIFVRNGGCVGNSIRNHIMIYHFFPISVFKIKLPTFRSTPTFDVGMPVALTIFCLTFVMPSARFNEKVSPGIGVEFLFIVYFYDNLLTSPVKAEKTFLKYDSQVRTPIFSPFQQSTTFPLNKVFCMKFICERYLIFAPKRSAFVQK